MKRFFAALFAVLVISFSTVSAFAQSMTGPPPYGDFPATKFPDDNFYDRPWVHREDRVLKKGPLAPSANDREALKGFLRKSNTGLIRLLPLEAYDSATYHTKKMRIPGTGAYYSFAGLTHVYGHGPDLELDHNKLSVGFAGADYGMLTNIGDTPLEQITLDDRRAQYIAAYRPPRSQPEARAEYRRLSSTEGMTFDGFLYHRSLPVQENSTYLLRSIVYRSSDVLVAFRLVRQDTDGSVIIAWKLLKRYPTPRLKRNNQVAIRNNQLADRRRSTQASHTGVGEPRQAGNGATVA